MPFGKYLDNHIKIELHFLWQLDKFFSSKQYTLLYSFGYNKVSKCITYGLEWYVKHKHMVKPEAGQEGKPMEYFYDYNAYVGLNAVTKLVAELEVTSGEVQVGALPVSGNSWVCNPGLFYCHGL